MSINRYPSLKTCLISMLLAAALTPSTNYVDAANILAMIPMPLHSHIINIMPIIRELANRGHNVTVVSPFPQKQTTPNITDIVLPNTMKQIEDGIFSTNWMDADTIFYKMSCISAIGLTSMPIILQLDQLQYIINNTEMKFDLIIASPWFAQEPLVAFGHKFNAPIVGYAFTLYSHVGYLTGNFPSAAYEPSVKFDWTDHMTFVQRVINNLMTYWDAIYGQLYYLPKQEAIMRKYFKYPGSENLPPLVDMLRNVSFTLLDYNPAIRYAQPFQRNVAFLGGANIVDDEKLPKDLQQFMDNAKDGVIYFSFGSFLQITLLEPHIQDYIFTVLSKIKYKVLIKLNDPTILQKYSHENIEVRKWFPQQAVLAHPNCKLFITHGGIHSFMDGVYHAVPILVIPLLFDQNFNARFAETMGIGYYLPRETITEKSFSKALEEVLTNPKYKKKMEERSAIFRDQPMKTLDNAIYWIEYVIRHKGAPHLRPAVLDLHWFQVFMLDVIAFYLFILIAIIFIVKRVILIFYRCAKCIFRRNVCNKKTSMKSKKNQ